MKQPQYGHKKQKNTGKLIPCLILAAGSLWALAVFFWFAHKVGDLYGFHPALGSPLMLGDWPTYSPFAAWGWPPEVWESKTVGKLQENCLMVFAALPMLLVIVGFAISRNQGEIKDLHGSAHWADKKEIEGMGYFGGVGVYVGGWWDDRERRQLYLRHNGPEHILCFAPTRSGKGVGLILPTLLSWPDSSVVLDIKGENYALTSGWLSSQGNRVLRFDPADATRTATRYNPLAEIRLESGNCIADVQEISRMVLDPDGDGLKDHWAKAAFAFFGAVILHCMVVTRHRENRCASMYDVILMMQDPNRIDSDQKALFKDMAATDHVALLREHYYGIDASLAESIHTFIASAAAGMVAKPDKEMGSIVSTAIVNLALYTDPVVAWNIGDSDFRLDDLMNRKEAINLYLVLSPANIKRLRPLIRIFVNQLLGRLTEKMEFGSGGTKATYKHRMLLMFDEFTSLGKLAIVEEAIAYMAGYGVKGYFIVQDTKQLNAKYGQDNALMANCHVRIAYAPNLPETAEYLSKLAGTTTVVQRKKSLSSGKGGGGSSTSVQETARPLLTPDECLRLPGIHPAQTAYWKRFSKVEPGDMLIFTAGHPPIYGKQILHFIDPTFLERASMDPVGSRFRKKAAQQPRKAEQQSEESAADAYLRYLDDLPEGIAEAAA